uniref:Borealin N-terminal domain-containing protein n=1 Tax=Cyanoptyche gloeocystis TaxID=77922 RepID=A0A7S2JMD0_9EUKA|mmetsp:Transcript_1441/g.2707  ORF Transcript_1441/g.2707 Transcript_1441/m.2707 type:complete len:233 (+) Transcript_1441:3-701(+)
MDLKRTSSEAGFNNEFDIEVDDIKRRVELLASNIAREISDRYQVEIMKLPKVVRQMSMEKFCTEYEGEVDNVILEALQEKTKQIYQQYASNPGGREYSTLKPPPAQKDAPTKPFSTLQTPRAKAGPSGANIEDKGIFKAETTDKNEDDCRSISKIPKTNSGANNLRYNTRNANKAQGAVTTDGSLQISLYGEVINFSKPNFLKETKDKNILAAIVQLHEETSKIVEALQQAC